MKRLAGLAETTIIDGAMESAQPFASGAKRAAEQVVEAMRTLSAAKDSTRNGLLSLLLTQ